MSDGHKTATHDNELVGTRQSLQQLAEHVVAGDLWRHTSRIGLRPTPGGFGQPEYVVDGVRRRIRIDGVHVVVLEGDVERWQSLSTLSGAAAFADTSVGAPEGLYTAATVAEPRLVVDRDSLGHPRGPIGVGEEPRRAAESRLEHAPDPGAPVTRTVSHAARCW